MFAVGVSELPLLESGTFPYQTLESYVRKRFEWRVEGCSRLISATEDEESKEYYSRRSPKFCFMNRIWFLKLYPNIEPAMHLFLYLEDGTIPITISVDFGISTVHGPIEWRIQRLCRYVADNNWNYNFSYRRAKTLISKADLCNRMSEFVQDDILTIVCNIRSEECLKFFRECVYKNESFVPRQLMPEARPWNMMFIVQNVNMLVDYDVLHQSCPALASEVKPGGTYLLDLDPRAYRQFLLYLYTGKIVIMELKELLLLFGLANYYKMDILRDRCLRLIVAVMVPENAMSLLLLAEQFEEKVLLKVIYKFIFEHSTQVLSGSLWMDFLRKYPLRANEICRLMGKIYQKRLGLASSEEFCREALKFHNL